MGRKDKKEAQTWQMETDCQEITKYPERSERDPESGDGRWGVNFTANGDGPPTDLDWGEIENYGTDGDLEQLLRSNGGTQGYGDLQTPTDVEAYKIFAKEQIARGRNGKTRRSFRQFGKKVNRFSKRKEDFLEMQPNAKIQEKETSRG